MDEKALVSGFGKIISNVYLKLSLDELLVKFGRVGDKPTFRDTAERVLEAACKVMRPMMVYRWLNVAKVNSTLLELTCDISGECTTIDLGFSIQFAAEAKQAIVGVYTVGNELENLAKEASVNGLHL